MKFEIVDDILDVEWPWMTSNFIFRKKNVESASLILFIFERI